MYVCKLLKINRKLENPYLIIIRNINPKDSLLKLSRFLSIVTIKVLKRLCISHYNWKKNLERKYRDKIHYAEVTEIITQYVKNYPKGTLESRVSLKLISRRRGDKKVKARL